MYIVWSDVKYLRELIMKPVIYAFIAMVFYASQNVIIEQKLSTYSTLGILIFIQTTLLLCTVLAVVAVKVSGGTIIFPTGTALWLCFGCGIIYFIADYFFIGAYAIGGNLYDIAVVVGLFSVIAFTIKAVVTGLYPNMYQIGGCLMAVVAVWLVSKGI